MEGGKDLNIYQTSGEKGWLDLEATEKITEREKDRTDCRQMQHVTEGGRRSPAKMLGTASGLCVHVRT